MYYTTQPITPSSCHRTHSPHGFTLIEGIISMLLLASVGALILSCFSFSVRTQEELRTELEASRCAGEILEILRATSYDSLILVENGGIAMEPLGKFQQKLLTDIQDRLLRENLSVFLTIRPYAGRTEMKFMTITIASTGLNTTMAIEATPPGKTLVKQSTYVTKKGINP